MTLRKYFEVKLPRFSTYTENNGNMQFANCKVASYEIPCTQKLMWWLNNYRVEALIKCIYIYILSKMGLKTPKNGVEGEFAASQLTN